MSTVVITAESLCFAYGKTPVLADLSFCLRGGEALAVVGGNGAGKSTLLGLLSGRLRPDSGRLTLAGRVSELPQTPALFEDMSAEANLRFFAGLAKTAVPKELPLGVDALRRQRVSRLSEGSKKRVSIVCSLLCSPDIWLLDEPMAGLDQGYKGELTELIRREKARGAAIVYVGHDPGEYASFADYRLCVDSAAN